MRVGAGWGATLYVAWVAVGSFAGCSCDEELIGIVPEQEIERLSGGPETDSAEPSPVVGDVVPAGDCIDADGDGFGTGPGCEGLDCDDGDAAAGASSVRTCYTGPSGSAGTGACAAGSQTCTDGLWGACTGETLPQDESCDNIDNDCDGVVDEDVSRACFDGPAGAEGVGVCAAGVQTCSAGVFGECAGQVLPTAETCDGIDSNCDGEIDERVTRSCYGGPAGTSGVGACRAGTSSCEAGSFGACVGEILPETELCDGVDNDCDGDVDEALVQTCYAGPAGTEGVGACRAGLRTCTGGAFGLCTGQVLPGVEVCDGIDNDCDGEIDEGITRVCYGGPAGTSGVGACTTGVQTCSAGSFGACVGEVTPSAETCDAVDNDCDGSVDEALTRVCYGGPAGTSGVGACTTGTQTCSAGQFGECVGEVTPAAETCDAVDNDCDGRVDEEVTRTCYGGPEGTQGIGACGTGVQTCDGGEFGACVGEFKPSAELCDGIDNDCDGEVDEEVTRVCYGGPAGTSGIGACSSGVQTCTDGAFGACAGEVTPSAETCDAVDNDCDGSVDENVTRSCYGGPDGTSGVGACTAGIQTCSAGVFGACLGANGPAAETCDAIDNDCDGAVDEEVTRACYGGPAGTSGVGACTSGVQTCSAGSFGACAGEITPAAETCDAIDNDCDGSVDEGVTRVCYGGPAGTSGVGACTSGVQTCIAGSFGACDGEVRPSAESCDAIDNDCDGSVDEGVTRVCYGGPAGTSGVGACTSGVQTCSAGSFGACAGEVRPSAESCDAIDNDCDGSVDEDVTRVCYGGPAGTEGVGACTSGVQTCSAGSFGACAGEVTPAVERCDAIDNDCDGSVDESLTRVCYGGPAGTSGIGVCTSGIQTCSAGEFGACAGEVTPSAETCDALDNDCDGSVDEQVTRVCYDGPAGTNGVGACTGGMQTCSAGEFGACVGDVTPAAETCDAVDNDCDGQVDEGITRVCYGGPDGTSGIGACTSGVQTCSAGGFGECVGDVTPVSESCDAIDNDCDGSVDEGVVRLCYDGPDGTKGVGACTGGVQFCSAGAFGACVGDVTPSAEGCDGLDNDCDGAVDENVSRACYGGPAGTEGVGACTAGVQTCTAGDFGACVGEVRPSAEMCDALDNDCDGSADEFLARACYSGPAGSDGVGLCQRGVQLCVAGEYEACEGEVLPAAESCDALDNDCDGRVDENLVRACYSGPTGTDGVGLCHAGTQTCSAGVYGACAGEVRPQTEICDAADNDCDGSVDEFLARACYSGPVGTDGVGVCSRGTELCIAGQYEACAGEVLPSAEQCDTLDNDCDGAADESLVRACYSGPQGTGGVGICRAGTQTCVAGAFGQCQGESLPGVEICDGSDNNCNGSADENETRVVVDGDSQQSNPIYRPVDIIFVIDNSCSMTDEIRAVETNINTSFASIIEQSGLDYRVIMLSKHGSASNNQSICIRPPLSGNTTCSNSCPVNGPRFFHYSVEIGSRDSLHQIVSTYNQPDPCGKAPGGWSQWLRPDAARVFIEITDDGPYAPGSTPTSNNYTADRFEAALFGLSPASFGTSSDRNYTFHSIAGLDENNPVLSPWLAADPLVTRECGGGDDVEQNGLEYQKLSVRTGGLRYPICQYQSFDAVFRQVAQGIVDGAQLACDFQVTSVPPDSSIDNTVLDFIPSNGGGRTQLVHVSGEAACVPNGFYTVGSVITLCPGACALWQQDPSAQIEVRFTCTRQIP